jgi:polysaccharide chain length determinant protein (PEP-CTERM system associated)
MNELLEQVVVYLLSIWRHRWIAMFTAWVIALGGWFWATTVPDRFEASTRVYIDTDTVLRPLLKGLAVETGVEQRLQLMTRTLLSRPNLEKLMRMTDLDIKATTAAQKEGMILQLQNEIKVTNLKDGKSRGASNFYSIAYEHHNRDTAKRVVQSLLDILVESSLGATRLDSTAAREFLDAQIREYEIKLSAAEERLGAFKRENMGFLPEQEGGYFGSLKAMHDKYDGALLELRESRNRRDILKKQLDEFRKKGKLSLVAAQGIQSPLQERIQLLKTRLDEMLLRYTERHPDVQELRLQLAALEEQNKAEIESLDGSGAGQIESNPMYQQLRIALGREESNIGAIEVRVREYASRIAELEKRIEKLQQVEVELNRLDRDYALNKENYAQLISRRDSAKLAGQAEQTGDSVQFRIIDPPFAPQKAAKPNRLTLNSMVFLVAIAGGMGLAFLLSQNNATFYNKRELQDVTGVAVFGSVTRIYSPKELNQRRLNHGSFIFAGALLVGVYGAVLLAQTLEMEFMTIVKTTVRQWL